MVHVQKAVKAREVAEMPVFWTLHGHLDFATCFSDLAKGSGHCMQLVN